MTSVLPRMPDIIRHLDDLRTNTYEGASTWPDRVQIFRRAVALLDPVVTRALAHVDEHLLDRSGEIRRELREADQAVVARWLLTWPVPDGQALQPVQVLLRFPRSSPHPHLGGTKVGSWPVQVLDTADAVRQEAVISTIVEAELNRRIWDVGWRAFPRYRREHG